MKLAVSGKGGVGKTTLSAMLAGTLTMKGQTVIAIDADPDANLGSALGVSGEEQITPLAEMRDMINERTGAQGGYFRLNPRVDDIPERFARRIGGIHLLVLGGVKTGGNGCICPATALVKALLSHLILVRDDVLLMDMEAGIEHLGRATAQSMDALIVVVTPGAWSHQTARRVRKLAGDIGLKNVFAVANRVRSDDEADQIRSQLGDVPLVGRLPVEDRLADGILRISGDGGVEPLPAMADNLEAVESILRELQDRL